MHRVWPQFDSTHASCAWFGAVVPVLRLRPSPPWRRARVGLRLSVSALTLVDHCTFIGTLRWTPRDRDGFESVFDFDHALMTVDAHDATALASSRGAHTFPTKRKGLSLHTDAPLRHNKAVPRYYPTEILSLITNHVRNNDRRGGCPCCGARARWRRRGRGR